MTGQPFSVTPNRYRFYRLMAAVPPFRPAAVQLLRAVDGSSQDLAPIVALLRSDTMMAAELMRAANSLLFGGRYEIRNPLQALSHLGLDRVKALVATTAMKALARTTHSCLTYACWRHNLATALICQKLSASANLPTDKCYMAGMIHDIGRLALLAVSPDDEYSRMLADSTTQDALAAERRLFGLNHAEAGCWLLSQWGCPIEMQNVAAFHENPAQGPNYDRAVIRLVHAGSKIADLMGMSVFASAWDVRLAEIASTLSGIVGEGLSVDVADMTDWVATRMNGIELSLF